MLRNNATACAILLLASIAGGFQCVDPLGSQYWLFALHSHDGNVCGKAWHHEDPSDDGDMIKCYVKVNLVNNELHVRVRMQDGLPAWNDPDSMVRRRSGPIAAQSCDADQPAGADWLEWTTYAFARPASEATSTVR